MEHFDHFIEINILSGNLMKIAFSFGIFKVLGISNLRFSSFHFSIISHLTMNTLWVDDEFEVLRLSGFALYLFLFFLSIHFSCSLIITHLNFSFILFILMSVSFHFIPDRSFSHFHELFPNFLLILFSIKLSLF